MCYLSLWYLADSFKAVFVSPKVLTTVIFCWKNDAHISFAMCRGYFCFTCSFTVDVAPSHFYVIHFYLVSWISTIIKAILEEVYNVAHCCWSPCLCPRGSTSYFVQWDMKKMILSGMSQNIGKSLFFLIVLGQMNGLTTSSWKSP